MAGSFDRFLLSGILTQDQPLGSLGDAIIDDLAAFLRQGNFEYALKSQFAGELLGSHLCTGAFKAELDGLGDWFAFVASRINRLLHTAAKPQRTDIEFRMVLIGISALHAFLQSNVTGPPLPFSVQGALFPQDANLEEIRLQCLASLTVEGVAPYELIPNVELFCLAKIILNCPGLMDGSAGLRWWRVRANILHQRLISEQTVALRAEIYRDVRFLESEILEGRGSLHPPDQRVRLLLEVAAIDTFYGLDANTRMNLDRAAKESGFEFAITGLLGKRTKFQEKDVSQLVVFARSAAASDGAHREPSPAKEASDQEVAGRSIDDLPPTASAKPKNLDLNDDTLLESISFSLTSPRPALPKIQESSSLPPSLANLNPSSQPSLKPLDSIILLSLANSITNLSPAHGLTREQTLPYAIRVLGNGSTNWQVYSQALLVRSRIEKYKSRTKERGLLQLQALVDQVIADTTVPNGSIPADIEGENTTPTFLPRPKEAEAAPVAERLTYIHQLCMPMRWELEMELASRWVDLGGMRTALEIFERLQMWAEAALCWAAADREDKAKEIIRKQLFSNRGEGMDAGDSNETWEEKDPPPVNAPRLWCIMGDIDHDHKLYERAWDVSKGRYARAQRCLGRHFFSAGEYSKAEEAYTKSLRINGLNHQSWFALGCARLELEHWGDAVEAFSRTVQLDDQDAEGWSNLATALLRREVKLPVQRAGNGKPAKRKEDEEGVGGDEAPGAQQARFDPERNKRDALNALKRAAGLKHESWRIWENLLTVAASMRPPAYADIVTAIRRITELQGPSQGDKCVDVDILELLIRHITTDMSSDFPQDYDPSKPGLQRLVIELIEKNVIPLITTSPRLWRLAAKLSLWRKRPASALSFTEKAWRATIAQEGWEYGTLVEARWDGVVDATIELADAYESLGCMETTEGLGAGTGQLVAKDWRFKARSAVRGVKGRGREIWEGTRGWERLGEVAEGLLSERP